MSSLQIECIKYQLETMLSQERENIGFEEREKDKKN